MINTSEDKSPQERQRDKTLKLLDTEGVENKSHESIPEEELEEASEDLDQNEDPFTEETTKNTHIAPTSKAGSSEIDTEKDSRFSKEHEIDESELGKNKQKLAKSGGGTN